MSDTQKLVFAAHDSGGSNALKPVIAFALEAEYDVRLILDGPALDVWADFDCPKYKLKERRDVMRFIRQVKLDMVITGTSMHSLLELWALNNARCMGIKTFSFIDAEMKLYDRFMCEELMVMPDHLGVISSSVEEVLGNEGWYPGEIHVVGQPHLQSVVANIKDVILDCEESNNIAFFSEPVTTDYPGHQLGYSQYDVAKILSDTLGEGFDGKIRVKPHPREDIRQWQKWVDGEGLQDRIDVVDTDVARLIGEAEFVCGMHSMALIEAALSGARVVCLLRQNERIVNPLLKRIQNIHVIDIGATDLSFPEKDAGIFKQAIMTEDDLAELLRSADQRLFATIEKMLD